MRFSTSRRIALLLAFGCLGFLSESIGAEPGNPGLLDRILHPDRKKKSSYEGKMFPVGEGFASKTFQTVEFDGFKSYPSKTFTTKTFEGMRQNWMAKLFFREKKLPGKFQETNSALGTMYPVKSLVEKSFSGGGRESSLSTATVFPTRSVDPDKRKSRQAAEQDLNLQEKIRKGLSEEDVRHLLNK